MYSGQVMAGVYIIVNKDNNIDQVTKEQVYRLFLKKTKRFQNGIVALPYAREEETKIRMQFNKLVLERSEQQLRYYWARKMFSGGEHPPGIIVSEQEVIDIVSEDISAISYVSDRPSIDKVKVVLEIHE